MTPDPAKTWQTCGGALLVAIGIFGCYYGARASRAHLLYRAAKHGEIREDVPAVLRACEVAHRIYPHNYYFCIWAAEKAYHSRREVDGEDRVTEVARMLAGADTPAAVEHARDLLES